METETNLTCSHDLNGVDLTNTKAELNCTNNYEDKMGYSFANHRTKISKLWPGKEESTPKKVNIVPSVDRFALVMTIT